MYGEVCTEAYAVNRLRDGDSRPNVFSHAPCANWPNVSFGRQRCSDGPSNPYPETGISPLLLSALVPSGSYFREGILRYRSPPFQYSKNASGSISIIPDR
jgi:hypothetical protein